MEQRTLFTTIDIGRYVAFLTWIVLAALIGAQILKGNFSKIKILSLYFVNTITFVLAWAINFKLAIIVRARILPTLEESINFLRGEADNFFSDFIIFSFLAVCTLAILNILYLKYFAKAGILKHTLAMSITELTILLVASYVSTQLYYRGLLQEVYIHFKQ